MKFLKSSSLLTDLKANSLGLAFLLCFLGSFAPKLMAESEVIIHRLDGAVHQNPNIPHEVKVFETKKSHTLPMQLQSNVKPFKPKSVDADFSPTFFPSFKPVQRMQAVSAQASCIEVMGEADLSLGELAFVRQMAIRDALMAASLYQNTRVISKQRVEDFQLKASQTHFVSHSRIEGFSVLREGKDLLVPKQPPCQFCDESEKKPPVPKVYQVVLKVCLTQEEQGCPSLPINFYQVPIAVALPVVLYPNQARDLKNLVKGVQLELVRRLRQAGYRSTQALNYSSLVKVGNDVVPNLDAKHLEAIRTTTVAQFLLVPVIRSTALVKQSDSVLNRMKAFYHFEAQPTQRHLEISYFWIDLFQNKVVEQQRLGFDVEGEVQVGRDKPVGSSAFFATDTGKIFHLLLDQMVSQLQGFLKCQNLVAEIIEKREDHFIVAMPQTTGIQVGDYLAVYHREGQAVNFQNRYLGYDLQPVGFIQVLRVMPDFVVAKVSGNLSKRIAVGDWVKAW